MYSSGQDSVNPLDTSSEGIISGIFIVREDGTLDSVNENSSEFMEFLTKGEIRSFRVNEERYNYFRFREYICAEDWSLIEDYLAKCRSSTQSISSVMRLRSIQGTTHQIQMTSIPGCTCYDQNGYLTIIHNLSSFQGLKDIFVRLEELNLVGKIAGSVAHEVRNPLTVVRGHLQLLSWEEEMKKYNEQIDTMITEIDRAVEILTELLYMSRPSTHKMERRNINGCLNHMYQLLNAEALVNLHQVVFELEEVPDVMLDTKRFKQVVLNLINNGFQAMETHSSIIIKTYAQNDKVYFSVTDHGTGIPPEVLHKLGTPFITTKPNGTGLGLAACYNIIAEHNAEIKVDTGPHGTTFTIIFNAVQ